jgi:HEAT repeat protein
MVERQRTAQFPITAIIGCLEDTNDPNVARTAAQILADLKIAPELYRPALVAGLQSKSTFTRESSAEAIGRFGERAASAIGALSNAMADPVPTVRFNAANALHAIDPITYTNAPPPPYWSCE